MRSKVDSSLEQVTARLRTLRIQNAAHGSAATTELESKEARVNTSLEEVNARIQALKVINYPSEAYTSPTSLGVGSLAMSQSQLKPLDGAEKKLQEVDTGAEKGKRAGKNCSPGDDDDGSIASTEVSEIGSPHHEIEEKLTSLRVDDISLESI